jgi:hypothetical protein
LSRSALFAGTEFVPLARPEELQASRTGRTDAQPSHGRFDKGSCGTDGHITNSKIVQGPWSSHDLNSPLKTSANNSLSRAQKRERRLFAQKAEADRIKAAHAVMMAAEAFARSINKMVASLALMQATPSLHGFRRTEGGEGGSFLPLRFEADGSVVYRRAGHTRALAVFTATERREFVKIEKANPGAAQGSAACRARELFAREMRAAIRRDNGAAS